MDNLCIKCKGKGLCGKPCKIFETFKSNAPKPKLHFSGKSSPELFVGRVGYPNINAGILAPQDNDNLANYPSAQEWAASNFSVANVLRLRSQLIYGRSKINIKATQVKSEKFSEFFNERKATSNNKQKISDFSSKQRSPKLLQTIQELAMASRPTSTEIFLKKIPTLDFTIDSVFQPMTNPAPIKRAILEENPTVSRHVDYLVNDTDAKSVVALTELYQKNTKIDHLQKLLSIGLLGKKSQRKMVPTRWSITATDDTISKEHLKQIRYFPHLSQVILFSGNYLGNYIEALLLPGSFAFEAIEAWQEGSTYNNEDYQLPTTNYQLVSDYENFQGRKSYAYNVTGGYYAMRLPLTEHLTKIKRQAQVLVFREIRPEYYAPLGVGIVREAAKRAFNSKPKYFDSIQEALENIKSRINTPIEKIKQKSWLLENHGKQKSIFDF